MASRTVLGISFLVCVPAWVCIAAPALLAAEPAVTDLALMREELGRRIKAFEALWEKTDDAAARKRAAARLAEMHPQFLTLRYSEAARTLDLATHALSTDEPPGLAAQWAASLIAVPEQRVVDGGAKDLTVSIRQLYPIKGELPKRFEVQLWFNDKQVVTVRPEKLPVEMKVPLPPLGDSLGLDRTLYCLVESGRTQRHYTLGISQVKDRDARIAALRKTTGGWTALDTIERATARDRAILLASLASGTLEETDLPAANLLANAETMLDGKPFFTAAKPGEYWMSIPLGGLKTAPVRVFVPRGLDPAKPVPVVVGLHGAGGSENLFFESYGAGRAIAECRKRGWLFIAPRSGLDFTGAPPVPAILDELVKRFPLDAKRTFLVGHSMGAGQVITLAGKHPGRFAAIACLGGGGVVRDAKPFETLPAFIAAGEKDFGLTIARDLHKALTTGGAKNASFQEYPAIEHFLIVREALPDVFTLFERVASGK